jgi:hypothetical protein
MTKKNAALAAASILIPVRDQYERRRGGGL